MDDTQIQAQAYTPPTILGEAASLLANPIPAADEDREIHLIALDALRYHLAVAACDSLQLLYQKRKQLLYPKDVPHLKLTELDRQTNLNADTAPLERDYQLLTRLEALLQARIELCLFLMSS